MQKDLIRFVRDLYYQPFKAKELFFHSSINDGELNGKRLMRSEGRESICLLLAACIASLNLANFKLETPLSSGGAKSLSWQDLLRFLPDGYKTYNGRPNDSIYEASRVLQKLNILGLVLQYEVMENGDKRAVPAIKWLNKNWLVKIKAVKFSHLTRVAKYTKEGIDAKFKKWRLRNKGHSDHIIAEAEYRKQLSEKVGEEKAARLLSQNSDRQKIDEFLKLKAMFPVSVIRKTYPELFI